MENNFTWTDREDEEIYKNGYTIMWVTGRTKSIQNFVEKLSYKIGYKCDFSFSSIRAQSGSAALISCALQASPPVPYEQNI